MIHPDKIRSVLTVFALLSFIGMIKRPFWGVISYLMIMMLRPGLYYPILAKLRIELVVGVLVILYTVFSGKIKRVNATEDSITKWMFILFGVMSLSMIQAMEFSVSWEWMNDFLKILLFFIMIVSLTDTLQDCEILLLVFGLLTATIAYEAIYNYITGNIVESMDESKRMSYAIANVGMGSGHVALSNMCNQALAVAWYVGVCHRNIMVKVFGVCLFIVLLIGVVVSGSRGGFIGLGAFFMCLILFSKKKLRIIMFELGVIGIIFIIKPEYLNFMKNVKVIGNTDMSTYSRFQGLTHGFQMLIRRPLLGVGPGCYPIARRAWFGWGLWAHNIYGEIMGDLGILGVIAFYKFIRHYLSKAYNLIKLKLTLQPIDNMCNAIIVATIIRLIIGMGSHSLYIFFWYMIAGVVVVMHRNALTELGKGNNKNEKHLPREK